MICAQCSKNNPEHYKFCLGCGAELSGSLAGHEGRGAGAIRASRSAPHADFVPSGPAGPGNRYAFTLGLGAVSFLLGLPIVAAGTFLFSRELFGTGPVTLAQRLPFWLLGPLVLGGLGVVMGRLLDGLRKP